MRAAWHVGPIEGAQFWWLLVTSPEILVFLFFMITDPKTIPAGRRGRWAYAVGVGLLATVLIAPQTTEFATKVAILGSLFVVCAIRGALMLAGSARLALLAGRRPRRRAIGAVALAGSVAYAGLVVAAGIPARPEATAANEAGGPLPEIVVAETKGVAPIGASSAQTIARNLLADLQIESDALRRRDLERAADAASGAWLASLWAQIRTPAARTTVASYDVDRMVLTLQRGAYQGPPSVVANLQGTYVASTYGRTPASLMGRRDPVRFRRTVELLLEDDTYRIVTSEGGLPLGTTTGSAGSGTLGGTTFVDVAHQVGLDFRQGAFRFGMSLDTTAMMGGGLCWLDYDEDGWLDLFVVNSYADVDIVPSDAKGGLPRSGLFHNVGGRFEDVSSRSGADLQLRGNGCVAADLDLDGHTDLYVTSAGYNVPTDGWDALLWNNGDGTFTEGAVQAGINAQGWHSAAVVGDVNGDGRPDLFVSSYTDPNFVVDPAAGFPSDHKAVRDLLYLNEGPDKTGRSTFREVARAAGVEKQAVGHGLGAVFTDVDRDGRLDLYVANDADPNQLYRNVPSGGALGFRFEDVGKRLAVDDPNAGMGIAAGDYSGDGRVDLFVTNSRHQLHAAYRSPRSTGSPYVDVRPDIAAVIGTDSTAWGDSWADLDLDGDLDLVLANGAIPVVNLAKDARRVQILENVARPGEGASLRAGQGSGPGPVARGERTRPRDRRLRQRRRPRRGSQHDRRETRAAPQRHRERAPLARGTLPHVRSGCGRHCDPRRRPHAGSRGARGSSYLSSEDPRVHFGLGREAREGAPRALPRRQRRSSHERRCRSDRHVG